MIYVIEIDDQIFEIIDLFVGVLFIFYVIKYADLLFFESFSIFSELSVHYKNLFFAAGSQII